MSLHDRLLPVIDLQRGNVVHAVAGQRAEYRPLCSQIVASVQPAPVAAAMTQFVGGPDVYVADLDAIEGRDPDWRNLESIRERGLHVWLDAGVRDHERLRAVLDRRFFRIILGLESLESIRSLKDLVASFPQEQLVFSLDLKRGAPLGAAAREALSIEEITAIAVDAGLRTIIVLDLADVGGARGGSTIEICRRIKTIDSQVELISGGGVRSLADVRRYVDAGCSRVLAATAIHGGAIEPRDKTLPK